MNTTLALFLLLPALGSKSALKPLVAMSQEAACERMAREPKTFDLFLLRPKANELTIQMWGSAPRVIDSSGYELVPQVCEWQPERMAPGKWAATDPK